MMYLVTGAFQKPRDWTEQRSREEQTRNLLVETPRCPRVDVASRSSDTETFARRSARKSWAVRLVLLAAQGRGLGGRGAKRGRSGSY